MKIKSELLNFNNLEEGVYAITGGAGAGKSTITEHIEKTYPVIHFDDFFIGDSFYRKDLLIRKGASIAEYIDACNQYNWWDWPEIFGVVDRYKAKYSKFFVEGAILGPTLHYYKHIFFVYESSEVRFTRICKRDKGKRNIHELMARFLVTEFSENYYYRNYLGRNSLPITYMSSYGAVTPHFTPLDNAFIPLEVVF